MHDHLVIEIVTIVGYLLLLISVGFVFNRMNRDTDDYFRGGCRGTWWLVGSSAFMTSFSAWTFTGAAGAAYNAGYSVLIIYVANAVGFFLSALFFAPWFRQLRVTTAPEVLELRYNEPTRQLSAYHTMLGSVFFSGLWLYGLAIFCSSVFGFDIYLIIIVLGVVVMIYSVVGGSWGIMANDFLQNILLFPLCLLICVLCLREVGGFSGLFQAIDEAQLHSAYALIKPSDAFPEGQYGAWWAFAILLNNTFTFIGMGNVSRYAAVKDGREASQAALLGGILMLLGAFVWLIPPMVGRVLYAGEIMGMPISSPMESAYAVTAMKVLPVGLTGMMVVAIFAATLSSMDTGLNRNTAIVIRDIYPFLCHLRKKTPLTDQARLMKASRYITLLFGLLIIGLALYYASRKGTGIFELMLTVMAVIGAPSAPANILGLFLRRAHEWAAMISLVVGWIPAVLSLFSESLFGSAWSYQFRFLLIFSIASLAYVATVFFWHTNTPAYREKVKRFFTRMHTPIDFGEEVGVATDATQLQVLGIYCGIIALAVAALGLIPTQMEETVATLALAGTLGLLGLAMYTYSRVVRRRQALADSSTR